MSVREPDCKHKVRFLAVWFSCCLNDTLTVHYLTVLIMNKQDPQIFVLTPGYTK